MDITIFNAGEILSRRGKGGKKGTSAKYADYKRDLAKHAEWLKQAIDESSDGVIRVKLEDFARETGRKMKQVKDGEVVPGSAGLDPTSLYWGFRYTLFHMGYSVRSASVDDPTNGKQPALIISTLAPGEQLPPSLAKFDKAAGIGTEVTGTETGAGAE